MPYNCNWFVSSRLSKFAAASMGMQHKEAVDTTAAIYTRLVHFLEYILQEQ